MDHGGHSGRNYWQQRACLQRRCGCQPRYTAPHQNHRVFRRTFRQLLLVTEGLLYDYAGLTGSLDYQIRADMTYFNAPKPMASFFNRLHRVRSGASDEWLDNSASRGLANVVNAFLKPGRVLGTYWTVEEEQWR